MSDIIRRGKSVPVQARRAQAPVDLDPQAIQIPGGGQIPVPPQQPGVTQNIIYVNVPAPQPQAVPQAIAPTGPSEIHVHNHIHSYAARRRGGRYGTSFVATLGFVLGGVACGVCFVPQLVWLARFIALVAGACAILGLLGSMLFRKNGAAMPVFGVIVSAFGYWLWMMKSGQAQLQLPKPIADAIPPSLMPTPSAPAPGSTPVPVVPTTVPPPTVLPATVLPATAPPTPPTAAAPSPSQTHLHDPSIFGDGGHWGNGTDPAQTPSPPGGVARTQSPPITVPAPTPAAIDFDTAAANLESARLTAARKLGLDYAGAKTATADAKTDYEQARATETPGSAALQSAGQSYLSQASKLTQMQKQLSADPGVAAAEAALKAAK
jgi:hypothetical protein